MAKIDYAKAKRRDQSRLAAFETRKRREKALPEHDLRQIAMEYHVAKRNLHCFKCKTTVGPWAKTKTEPDGRRWAICAACVDPSKAKKQPRSG